LAFSEVVFSALYSFCTRLLGRRVFFIIIVLVLIVRVMMVLGGGGARLVA
jgi:hypothetical protein